MPTSPKMDPKHIEEEAELQKEKTTIIDTDAGTKEGGDDDSSNDSKGESSSSSALSKKRQRDTNNNEETLSKTTPDKEEEVSRVHQDSSSSSSSIVVEKDDDVDGDNESSSSHQKKKRRRTEEESTSAASAETKNTHKDPPAAAALPSKINGETSSASSSSYLDYLPQTTSGTTTAATATASNTNTTNNAAVSHQHYNNTHAPPAGANSTSHPLPATIPTDRAGIECMTFQIVGSQAGSIIGKGGSLINRTRDISGCSKVTVQPAPHGAAERTVILQGTKEQIQRAYEDIQLNLKMATGPPGPGASAGGRFGGGGPAGEPPMRPGEHSLQIMVPSTQIGGLIGKGGSVIQYIRQTSRCNVKILSSRDMTPGTNERAVILRGTEQQVQSAQQLIAEKLATVDVVGGGNILPDGNVYHPAPPPRRFGGGGGGYYGGGGGRAPHQSSYYGGRGGGGGGYPPSAHNPYYGGGAGGGAYGSRSYPQHNGPAGGGAYGAPPHSAYNAYGGGGTRGPASHAGATGPVETITMQVTGDVAGRVIGRGGSAIMEIRRLSNAHVEVGDKGILPNGMREIRIIGGKKENEMAQYLVGLKMMEGSGV